MDEIVSSRRGIPHADTLVMACCDDLVGARRPLDGRDGSIVRNGVEVEMQMVRPGAETRRRCLADHPDCVVEVEGGKGCVGAADVEEKDLSVGRAGTEDVAASRGPGEGVDCAVGAGERMGR